ncbi:hypothetical protein DFP73DRAFT_535559 [Morchella snyderi]|nr:hypothetical protein DFP73DRAFT_535559 [Morchella snyderi]
MPRARRGLFTIHHFPAVLCVCVCVCVCDYYSTRGVVWCGVMARHSESWGVTRPRGVALAPRHAGVGYICSGHVGWLGGWG